jgi:hypothetical protein
MVDMLGLYGSPELDNAHLPHDIVKLAIADLQARFLCQDDTDADWCKLDTAIEAAYWRYCGPAGQAVTLGEFRQHFDAAMCAVSTVIDKAVEYGYRHGLSDLESMVNKL